MSPFVVQRTEAAYGPDAEIFRPERWLDQSEETLKMLNRNLITFGSGTRICLGKHITNMEVRISSMGVQPMFDLLCR